MGQGGDQGSPHTSGVSGWEQPAQGSPHTSGVSGWEQSAHSRGDKSTALLAAQALCANRRPPRLIELELRKGQNPLSMDEIFRLLG
jgi:hypothetical protein